MRINFFSDIHLEFGTIQNPETDADIIIAAGDIGLHTDGAKWLKSLSKKVIYVAGNHEFYAHEYHQTLHDIRQECAQSNVFFLEKEELIVAGVRFLGCTLWTDLYSEGQKKALTVADSLNDFNQIKFRDALLDQKDFSDIHLKTKQWLTKALNKPFDGKTIVVTHHAPTEWSWNDSPSALKKIAYCNNLKELFHEHDITAWFHGHIHSIGDYRIAGARILSNPRGYVGRKLVKNFDVNKTIEI